MNKIKYQDGVEVLADQLNFTESSKSTAIKDRKDFVQSGVARGLRVTKPAGTATISIGVGYCANGERIEVPSDITGVVVTPGQYNFITLIYKEVEQKLKPHEKTGTSYTTEVTETYTVEVLSTSAYNSLTQLDRDNRVLVAIEKDGVIQQSYDLSKIVITNDVAMQGVWIGQFSENTLYGKCSIEFNRSTCKIRYKAPVDSYGAWGDINVNYSDKQSIKLTSGNIAYWVYVEVLYPILPVVSTVSELKVLDLYKAILEGSMEVRHFTSTGTVEDQVHRATHMLYYPHYKDRGGPKENNPHGTHASDLTGFQGDVIRHQDLMHCNGIITKDFLPTIVVRESKKFQAGVTTSTVTLSFHSFVLAVYKVEASAGLNYTIFTEGEDYIVNLANGTITRIAGSDIPIGGTVYVTYKYQKTNGEISALRPTCDTTNKKVTVEELGEDNCYHINGVVFWEVEESFPWVYTFGVGTWLVVLGADKKFHVFQNSYDTKNYIPIVRVEHSAGGPVLYIDYITFDVATTVGINPSNKIFKIKNVGGDILNFKIYQDVGGWITCSTYEGFLSSLSEISVVIVFDVAGLSEGTYKAHLWVYDHSALGSPKTVEIILTISS